MLLTKDKRIRYNELEKTAVLRHGVREFYFSSGNYSGTEMAEMLIDALREWPASSESRIRHSSPALPSQEGESPLVVGNNRAHETPAADMNLGLPPCLVINLLA